MRWAYRMRRTTNGGIGVGQAKKLKRLVADLELDKRVLKDVAERNF